MLLTLAVSDPVDEWEEEEREQRQRRKKDPPVLSIGLYVKKGSIVFKVSVRSRSPWVDSRSGFVHHHEGHFDSVVQASFVTSNGDRITSN